MIPSTTSLLTQLDKVLPAHGTVLIVTHNAPDPDALAAAAGMQLLLRQRWSLKGQIVFSGQISRPENRELMRHFLYRTLPPEKISARQRHYPAIFTDTTPRAGNVSVPAQARAVAVFDHHQTRRPMPGILSDLHPGLGAITTRIYECLRTADIAIPRWLTTVMAYAISSETADFTRAASPRDIAAYRELLASANMAMLGRIRLAPLPTEHFAFLAEGIRQARVYRQTAWTHLAATPQPEIVAEISDLLLRMERITRTLCTGVMCDRLLFAFRNQAQRDHRRLLHRLAKLHHGSYGGHGHVTAGSFELPRLPGARQARVTLLTEALISGLGIPRTAVGHPLIQPTGVIPCAQPAANHAS
ncbi:MAG: bifunctional oligoribonuclease/PAP phosphatase NrnA [Kiritimatiellia bacterium]